MTRKAPNGLGTTHQRKDGSWQGQVTLPAQGLSRSQRRSVYGETQAEVLAKMRALRAQTTLGVRPGKSPTLAEYGREYLEVTLRAQVDLGLNAESTLRNYRNIWKRHIEPDLGHLRLDQVTPTILRQWQVRKSRTRSAHRDQPLSGATQVRIHAVLHAALASAYRDELMPYNPLDKVKRPRNAKSKIVPLAETELTSLVRRLEGTRFLHTLVLLMAMTGARPGEALAASWMDVDLDAETWHISRSLVRLPVAGRAGSKMTLGVSRTKTAASDATITLPQLIVAALRQHRARQAEERLATKVWQDPDLVFASSVGSLLEPRNVRREFQAMALEAGIVRRVRLHDLRHAAASALLDEGVDIAVTSKLLRHSRLSTTSDIYSHLTEQGRSKAADVMDQRFRRLMP